jgi:hypothetical protein
MSIDLGDLPPILTTKHLSQLLDKSLDSLAQERWLGKGIPFVKYGSRVYYLRDDVAAYLVTHRTNTEQQGQQDQEQPAETVDEPIRSRRHAANQPFIGRQYDVEAGGWR